MKHHLPSRRLPGTQCRWWRRLISPVQLFVFSCTFIICILLLPRPASFKLDLTYSNKAICATVEEMGESLASNQSESTKESLRIREIIKRHFDLHGARRVRELPAKEFCKRGFVLGKASEAGFGNDMYKILTGAALSIMLDRSFIVGQTSFEGTADTVGIQFFLKNINPNMRNAALDLFGNPNSLESRPNVFGELMRFVISPSESINYAVNWVLQGTDPDITLHMRMFSDRSDRSIQAKEAAVKCIKKAIKKYITWFTRQPRILLVSDTPSFIHYITPNLTQFAEVLYFDYKSFQRDNPEVIMKTLNQMVDSKASDWGPAPRWVAIVDFFLASRARHSVISGARSRVGTTYAQLIACLATSYHLSDDQILKGSSNFTFLSSFQSELLIDGLSRQAGWGHVWNRFAGPLSCRGQTDQCAIAPVLPSAWWDAAWQSPIERDVRKLIDFGVSVSEDGEVNETGIRLFCSTRKEHVGIQLLTRN